MNISINTNLKGVYIIEDENRNEICRSDNLITDYGMARLVGDPNLGPQTTELWNRAFVYNITELFVGSDNATTLPLSTNNFQLGNLITSSNYTKINDTASGTQISINSSDQLVIKFIKSDQFVFNSSHNIREIGCHWTDTFTNTLSGGIFSRSILPGAGVSVINNSRLFIRYELTITSNCHQVLENMPFQTGTDSFPLPLHKTNIRRLPFFRLSSNGLPEQDLANTVSGTCNATDEFIPPLFEDLGLLNRVYVGRGTNNTTCSTPVQPDRRRKWRLQTYGFETSFSTSARYDTFTSTTSSSFSNGIILTQTINAEVNNFRMYPNEDILISSPQTNLWQKKLRFLFAPPEWNTVNRYMIMYPCSDGLADSLPRIYINNPGTGVDAAGILTAFNATYNPYQTRNDIYVGFEYIFTFTR
jgi:hypothetical protein